MPHTLTHICDVTDQIYCNISHHVVGFLGWKRTAYSEDGLHAGTDFFLKIVMAICGAQQFRNNREMNSVTTTGARRPDSYLSLMGITLVRVEEKAGEGKLKDARKELTSKMQTWLPHLENVPFIVGIAIAGSIWSIHTIDHQLKLSSTPLTFDMSKVVDRVKAVRIAV